MEGAVHLTVQRHGELMHSRALNTDASHVVVGGEVIFFGSSSSPLDSEFFSCDLEPGLVGANESTAFITAS